MAIASNLTTTNQGFKSFVPKGYFTTEYVYYLIKNLLPIIINNASGSTFKEVSGNTLKSLSVCVANEAIIKKFSSTIIATFQRQESLQQQNQRLSDLRDWLLPMLMTGQVLV